MAVADPADPEIFTVRDIARAAEVTPEEVRALLDDVDVLHVGGRFVGFEAAVGLVRTLRAPARGQVVAPRLFAPAARAARERRIPVAASGALHAAILTVLIVVAGLGLRGQPAEPAALESPRLVFLATPGPGGGGGGGGLRNPLPPPAARLKGASSTPSPVIVARKPERPEPKPEPVRRPEPPAAVPVAVPDPVPPPEPPPVPVPPVAAPVVSAPADPVDRVGVVAGPEAGPSNGPGTGGGTGTGRGPGSGSGEGAGIGPGSGGGTGGGPYRPGSGVTPPSLQREVKPVYTEEGRRRGVEGDVMMEVVVRADGTVGSVKIVRGLGAGLDERAADAVRQWRFFPARRLGTAVDVLVEVAVEFRLR